MVGVFNMDEYVYGFVIENIYYGVIFNFWDFICIFGGFFGGFVVVVVVGLVFIIFGFDINGFICVFVFLCGVFGFKFIYGCLLWVGVFLFVSSLDYVGFFVCFV